MSRVIKFRAWNKPKGLMRIVAHISNLLTVGTYVDVRMNEPNAVTKIEEEWNEDDFILMQYTGLKDMHDKECYQGDICEDPCIGLRWEVTWHEEKGCWYLCPVNDDYQPWGAIGIEHITDFEIVGNGHENPELLNS